MRHEGISPAAGSCYDCPMMMEKELPEPVGGLWIAMPAFNEAAVIAEVLAPLCRAGYPVVVVDDGSSDATADMALAAGAVVLRHAVNLGQGAALQTAMEYCLQQGARYICTFDADGQHDPADIPRLFDALTRQGADVALGSRFLGQAPRLPASRRLLLKAAVAFMRLYGGLKLTDAHNGLRLFTRDAARRFQIRQARMAHASEMVRKCHKAGLKIIEVPCTIRYTDYSLSKGQGGLGSINILLDLFLERLHR